VEIKTIGKELDLDTVLAVLLMEYLRFMELKTDEEICKWNFI
jgi:hypothetical protein